MLIPGKLGQTWTDDSEVKVGNRREHWEKALASKGESASDLPSNSHHLEIGACTAEVVSWYVDEVCFKIVRGLRYLFSFKRDRRNIPWLSSRHSSGIRC